MSNLLITGGAGFIGSSLCNKLIKKKHKIWTIDNFSTNSLALILASDLYNEKDYLRNYDKFKRMVGEI